MLHFYIIKFEIEMNGLIFLNETSLLWKDKQILTSPVVRLNKKFVT